MSQTHSVARAWYSTLSHDNDMCNLPDQVACRSKMASGAGTTASVLLTCSSPDEKQLCHYVNRCLYMKVSLHEKEILCGRSKVVQSVALWPATDALATSARDYSNIARSTDGCHTMLCACQNCRAVQPPLMNVCLPTHSCPCRKLEQ